MLKYLLIIVFNVTTQRKFFMNAVIIILKKSVESTRQLLLRCSNYVHPCTSAGVYRTEPNVFFPDFRLAYREVDEGREHDCMDAVG